MNNDHRNKSDKEMKSNDIFTVTCAQVPEYVTCPNCGLEIEFWTAADITRCFFCGHRVYLYGSTVH